MKLKSAPRCLIALVAIVFCLAIFLTFKFSFAAQAEPKPALVPMLNATKTAAVAPQASPVGLTGARSNSRPYSPAASGTNVQMNLTAASATGGSLRITI